jgi:hypothetical protein
MRASRREGRSLDDFLDAAGEGSIDGVQITRTDCGGVQRYTVECDDLAEDATSVAFGTLKEWWTEAGREDRRD